MCPRTNSLHQAGEDCRPNTQGMYLITTNSVSPYASGQWMNSPSYTRSNYRRRDPFEEQIDEWGKLDGEFNYVPNQNQQTVNPNDWSQLNHIESIFANFNKLDDDLRTEAVDASTKSTTTRQNDRYYFTQEPLRLNELNLTHYKSTNENFTLPEIVFEEN